MSVSREEAVIGCLLGTAVGDGIGLCCEGLKPALPVPFGLTSVHNLFFLSAVLAHGFRRLLPPY
jgi:hypothetical protein